MPVLDFLNHLLNFVAPAVFLALVLALGACVLWRKRAHLLPWYLMSAVNLLLGVLVLALGVVLTGHDGRMGTYAVLVLAMGSCQWLMSQGWRG
ncbi:hypothetical protein AX13_12940 [Comamonas aquatica DA1877]|uniref:Uncharacterized protein n=1 Tax=Comamonas aquatica DA1877 TaxID=1457173 RepID=A0A014P4C9_9BURK|nr:hypothetical protein [Comamonas aquatica]EXU81025.1 hypothetical protein AX13_12940 [Comamonas aquatica DA1877]